LRLKNDEFEDGWNFVRTGSALQLEKKIKNRGWHFIRVTDGLLRSGIGGTPQEAIACGLKLALHHVSVFFNTVEIDRIGLTQWPASASIRAEFTAALCRDPIQQESDFGEKPCGPNRPLSGVQTQ
jgi:hypothetical protein